MSSVEQTTLPSTCCGIAPYPPGLIASGASPHQISPIFPFGPSAYLPALNAAVSNNDLFFKQQQHHLPSLFGGGAGLAGAGCGLPLFPGWPMRPTGPILPPAVPLHPYGEPVVQVQQKQAMVNALSSLLSVLHSNLTTCTPSFMQPRATATDTIVQNLIAQSSSVDSFLAYRDQQQRQHQQQLRTSPPGIRKPVPLIAKASFQSNPPTGLSSETFAIRQTVKAEPMDTITIANSALSIKTSPLSSPGTSVAMETAGSPSAFRPSGLLLSPRATSAAAATSQLSIKSPWMSAPVTPSGSITPTTTPTVSRLSSFMEDPRFQGGEGFGEDSSSMGSPSHELVSPRRASDPDVHPRRKSLHQKIRPRGASFNFDPTSADYTANYESPMDRKRHQNRVAAYRYRLRRKLEREEKFREAIILGKRNKELQVEVGELEREINYVKELTLKMAATSTSSSVIPPLHQPYY